MLIDGSMIMNCGSGYIYYHIYETALNFYAFFRRTKKFQNSNTMYKR